MRRTVRAIRAEWTKLTTLPSTAWLLLLAILSTVGLSLVITGWMDYNHCDSPCALDTTRLSLAGVRLGQVGILVLAVLAATAEYGTRTIQATLLAVPRRILVVVGKVAVLGTLAAVAGILAVTGSLVAARLVLPGNGFTAEHGFPALSLADDLTRRAAFGTVLYIGLVGLLGAGLGLLVRDTAGALTAGLGLLYGAPVVAMFVTNPTWQNRIHRYSPMDAGLVIQSTRNLAAEHIGPWAGLGVLSLYAAAAIIAGLIVFHIRDAR